MIKGLGERLLWRTEDGGPGECLGKVADVVGNRWKQKVGFREESTN